MVHQPFVRGASDRVPRSPGVIEAQSCPTSRVAGSAGLPATVGCGGRVVKSGGTTASPERGFNGCVDFHWTSGRTPPHNTAAVLSDRVPIYEVRGSRRRGFRQSPPAQRRFCEGTQEPRGETVACGSVRRERMPPDDHELRHENQGVMTTAPSPKSGPRPLRRLLPCPPAGGTPGKRRP